MAKYRKKPVVIEAVQLTRETLEEVRDFMGGEEQRNVSFTINFKDGAVSIHTLEGKMRASLNDWIIKGVKGEFYPCKPDIFAQTYEKVED